jgi:hypothetical protein
MKKIIITLLLFLPFYITHAETQDEIASTGADYVNACHAGYYLKMTHCKGVITQKTTNCLKHGISLFPKKERKTLTEMLKKKLNEMSLKSQDDVEKGFEKALNDNNQDKDKACQIFAEDLTDKKNDSYYEFSNALKATFPSHK